MRGKLIVFEGIDGTGKGTQMNWAEKELTLGRGLKVVRTKEPGGTPLGDAIREVLYEKVPMADLAPGVIDCLFLSSHLQNWQVVVNPSLAQGKIVLCDRWWYSQMAYMQHRTVPAPIAKAYLEGKGGPADLFIFLYGDPKTMLERANSRTTETHQKAKVWNNIDALAKIQQSYLDLFSAAPEFYPICVDGKDQPQVWIEVEAAITGVLNA